MSYKVKYLQFGTQQPVPQHPTINTTNLSPPIPPQLAENSNLWALYFSYEAGKFYKASDHPPQPPTGGEVDAYYAKIGGGPGPHGFGFTPFLLLDDGSGAFATASNFVDFDQPGGNGSGINTDTIPGPSVTATVHASLPEYSKTVFGAYSTSQSIVLTTTTTQAAFDSIFVYGGDQVPSGDTLTVAKNTSCLALAIFKLSTVSHSKEISTTQYPKIPKWEWVQNIEEIVSEVIQSGEAYQGLDPRQISAASPEMRREVAAGLTARIESLTELKNRIGAAKRGK